MTTSTLPPIHCVVGARPNFMKIAPILDAFSRASPPIPFRLIHTGQHYDRDMQAQFFEQLNIPLPDEDLGVGSASHAVQTAEIMRRFEAVLNREPSSAVLVVGDVNSTIACAMVAAKLNVPVIHVEAGLRSYDRTMPEEINRVLTDQISDLLFTTERASHDRLKREGIAEERIHFVGNVMIDTLFRNLNLAAPIADTLEAYRRESHAAQAIIAGGDFGLVTLHRPSNVDDPKVLGRLLDCLNTISEWLPLALPLHPRTRARMGQFGLVKALNDERILCTPPLGYLEMLGLTKAAKIVLTDSGGLQEETTALGVPCLTLRENTERPITVEQGTNTIVGANPERILAIAREALDRPREKLPPPDGWDGHAAERIANVIGEWLQTKRSAA